MEKKSGVLLIGIVSTIILLSTPTFMPQAYTVSPLSESPASNGLRLGFWLQEADIYEHYSASTFFNTMFLTPPYPSSLEVMIFGILQDETNGFGCSTSSHYTGESASYWGQVASMADNYPSIRLVYEIAFDPSSTTYGIGCFDSLASVFAQYPSVYGIGIEGEYTTNQVSTSTYQSAMSEVQSLGKQFINYYPQVTLPTGALVIGHTNFPSSTDPESTLTLYTSSEYVGMDSGYYDNFPFPGTATCPISSSTYGVNWNQCVEQTELSTALGMPSGTRQFLEFDPGFDASGSFTGVSGQSTNQLWDNPTLRNWIWTDPNYQPNFILSTSTTTTSTATTGSASTSTSSTDSTTTLSTSSSTTASTTSSSTSTTSSAPALYTLSTYVTCPAGITSCGTASPVGSSTYDNGTTITLSATPYGGYQFSSWSICSTSCQSYMDNPHSLVIGANTQATAIFISSVTTTSSTSSSSTTTSFTATTVSLATSSSSVSQTKSTKTGISSSGEQDYSFTILSNCPSTGAGSYPEGSVVAVTFAGVCNRNGGSGLRVTSWSLDGGGNFTVDTNDSVSVSVQMNAPHTLRLYTVPQYSLTLDYGSEISMLSVTTPTIPGDDYWYDSGTLVTFVGKVNLQGYAVSAWALDGEDPIPVSDVPSYTSSFVMTSPHTLHAILTPTAVSCASGGCGSNQTVDVTIQTNTGLPSGLWIDEAYYPKPVTFAWQAGSVHNITAAEGGRQSSVRSFFTTWSGLSESKSQTLFFTANESGYLIAAYSKQYLIFLAFTDASGGPLTPQSVTLSGPTGSQELGSNLTAWVEPDASYTITSAVWMNWNVVISNDSAFTVDQPVGLTFSTDVFLQTIKATDVYNLPLQGATVNVTALNGVELFVVTDAQGIAQFRVPVGLFSATIQYMGVRNQITAESEGSHSFAVSFLLSYPFLATLGTVFGLSGLFLLIRLRRKRPEAGSFFYSDQE